MQSSSLQTNWELGGFLRRVLDSLSAEIPVNAWGQPLQPIEKVVGDATIRLCALAYEFHKAGKADELGRQASDGGHHQFAGLLVQLALRAWSFQRRRMGFKAEGRPEDKEAWHSLQAHLKVFFRGDSQDAAAVRDSIRNVCEAVLNGEKRATTPIGTLPTRQAPEHRPGAGMSVNENLQKAVSAGKAGTPRRLKSRKEPSKAAFITYRLRVATGKTQKELAKLLTDELKRPVDQGTVSRWLKQVKEWLRLGNVLPDLTETPNVKPMPLDPERIDLGARQDHLVERQKGRRNSRDDD
jgi:hypothetical protein